LLRGLREPLHARGITGQRQQRACPDLGGVGQQQAVIVVADEVGKHRAVAGQVARPMRA
jgi:hypothetical protein